MYKFWPSTGLFVFAAWLFLTGCYEYDKGQQFLVEHPPSVRIGAPQWVGSSDRDKANRDMEFGRYKQIGGGVLAVVGVVLFGVGKAHQQAQAQALKHRLTVTYTLVPIVPAEGLTPGTGLLTEDQAAESLRTRYPTLAQKAVETLQKEFAEKRRLEPTQLWFVKDFQVCELSA